MERRRECEISVGVGESVGLEESGGVEGSVGGVGVVR